MHPRLLAASLILSAVLNAAEYRAQDGSFSLPIPSGWNAQEGSIGGVTVHVLSQGEDRILIRVEPAQIQDLTQLAQWSMAVTTQAFPALRPSGAPAYPAGTAEIRYGGYNIAAWQALTVREGQGIGVTAIARPDRVASAEQAARTVLQGIRLAQPNTSTSPLSRVIVGRWTWSHATWKTSNVSRVVVFYPNGRFDFQAATHMTVSLPDGVDPTTRITGTYRVQGDTVFTRADNGQTAQYQVQIVEGGRALRVNGDLYIRE